LIGMTGTSAGMTKESLLQTKENGGAFGPAVFLLKTFLVLRT
jgi:hypothetical protein